MALYLKLINPDVFDGFEPLPQTHLYAIQDTVCEKANIFIVK